MSTPNSTESKSAPSPALMPRMAPSAPSTTPRYQRGEIWLVTENPNQPPVGTELWSNRPAIIISNNVTGNHSGFVQVVYLTTSTRKRSGPTHIPLTAPTAGNSQDETEALALCEQIHTVDTSRLRKRMGYLGRNKMVEIDQAIALTLSLGRNPDTSSLFKKWEQYILLHGIDMAAEIQALAGHTTDQRVEAMARALQLVTSQRDSYKQLYEIAQQAPMALELVSQLTTGEIPKIDLAS